MYLPETSIGSIGDLKVQTIFTGNAIRGYEWVDAIVSLIENYARGVWSMLGRFGHGFWCMLKAIAQDPGAYANGALIGFYDFLCNHSYIVYLTSLSLFLGPMVILVPFLLFRELSIFLAFNLRAITHGWPGRTEQHYHDLEESWAEAKEKVFATVDSASNTFNEWTTKHPILMVIRVLAGLLGICAVSRLWGGWSPL